MTDESIESLQQRLSGQLYTPESEGYEERRLPWSRNIDSHPALIAEPETDADVQLLVRFAAEHTLPVAVQSSGHGAVKSTDGGLVIRTTRMNDIAVDPSAKTLTVGAGVLWADVLPQTDPYNLAPITGDSPWVGVMGFSLGGGQGWLSRQYGLASQSIIAARLVTADGELVVANADQNQDLLWALRGGSGNFGVVVSLTIALHDANEVFGGSVYFDAEDAEALLQAYRTWLPNLPDQYSPFLMATKMPPLPNLPESIRGRNIVLLQSFFNGPAAEGRQILDGFLRQLDATPIEDFAGATRYAAFMADAPKIPGSTSAEAVGLQATLSDEQITTLASYMRGEQAVHPMVQIRPWGGALGVSDDQALLTYASTRFSIAAILPLGRMTDTDREAALTQFAALQQDVARHASEQVFINFSTDTTKTKSAFTPQAYARLARLKYQYDPNNMFRLNHNIVPEAKKDTLAV